MKNKQTLIIVVITNLCLGLSTCTIISPSNPMIITTNEIAADPPAEYPKDVNTPSQSLTNTQTPQALVHFGLTFQQADGNRFVLGQGNLPSQTPIEINLARKPVWVVGTPYHDGAIFIAVQEDGNSTAYYVSNRGDVETVAPPSPLASGMPAQVKSSGDDYSLVTVPSKLQSLLTHPVFLPQSDWRAYITQSGDLEFIDPSDKLIASLQVNALPDARILDNDKNRLLLLTEPTDLYNHGVLGDNLEARSITLIETQPYPQIVLEIKLHENEVVEGIAPIWVDITGDNQREIIVTTSDSNLGAGIVIFSEDGERLAEAPKMGQPFRWRHQVAFGPFGLNGENELAVVRTPHIGGAVEFYRYSDGGLSLIAEHPGVTSHILGSRNLDMSIAGDFDGDGLNELLVLNPDLSELIALRRISAGVEEVWRIPIGGKLATNLAGVTLPNSNILFALGRDDGMLLIWAP